MVILNRRGSLFLSGAAAVAALVLTAGPAFAATPTWTITPGGDFSAKAGTTTLTDTSTNNALSCTSSSTSGSFKSGSGLAGAGAGSIAKLSFSNCTGPLGLTFKVKTAALPWAVNLISYKSATGVSKVTITGIHATLSGPSCTAVVDGTSATADNGKVAGTYTNGTSTLKVLATGGTLHIYNVKGCAGLLNSGDATTFVGSYKLAKKQTITSP